MAGMEDLVGSLLAGQSGGGKGGLGGMLGGLLGGKRGGSGGAGAMGMAAALTPLVTQFLGSGGLSKMLEGFKQNGMAAQADSWVGTGPNQEITGAQVQQVMTDEQLTEVAQQLGVPKEKAADALAKVIPGVVNEVTPNGTVPSTEELATHFGH
jgi:uncharacterized protein YidB (DUF937 family)